MNIELDDKNNMNHDTKKPFVYTSTELERIDYVLVFSKEELEKDEHKRELRERFENALRDQGILLEEEADKIDPNLIYIRIFTPFKRLAEEAEFMKLEMPLEECQIYDDAEFCFDHLEQKYLITDNEDDFVSAPFFISRLHMYKGKDNEKTFFRSSLRILLTYHILIHTDIREMTIGDNESLLSKKALPHLLMTGVYTDAFPLHEPSSEDSVFTRYDKKRMKRMEKKPDAVLKPVADDFMFGDDHRKSLNDTWTQVYKYQPMWKIRNYFGEKIAFYFAWSGHLISMLWIPTLFGIICFIYGLYLRISVSIQSHNSKPVASNMTTVASPVQKVTALVEEMLGIVKEAFDNVITPFFAISICLWGTVLTETWKRTRHRLAYEWDVVNFSDAEPDRPQFVGTTRRLDPITKDEDWYYPMRRQFMKFCASFVILVAMICIVFISVASVIVYRVFVTVKYCNNLSIAYCFLINVIVSSLLNALSILLLGKFYDWVAMKLTDWENHRTQTSYDDALILKLFAFQFANSYSSLIYIAFFRGNKSPFTTDGVFGMGSEYVDSCGGDGYCMPMLSFQVLVLMFMKPMPKLLMDIVLPWLLKLLKRIRKRCCGGNRVETEEPELPGPDDAHFHVGHESKKLPLKDFTIPEYMEKVIQYGYLMLFASSFPLAPLIALLTNVCDRYVDAKRLLWLYRRPNPQIVSSIGMWEIIVEFLNAVGVITNAFIIAFTSSWGRGFSVTNRLIIVLGVEHAIFALKFFTMAVIPDVPGDVQLSIRREKYQVQQILESGDLLASSASLRPALNAKVVDRQSFLYKLPLNVSDPPSRRDHPHPAPFPTDDLQQRGDEPKERDSALTTTSPRDEEANASGRRLPPLNAPVEGDSQVDEEVDFFGLDKERSRKRRKKKKKRSRSDTVEFVDETQPPQSNEVEV